MNLVKTRGKEIAAKAFRARIQQGLNTQWPMVKTGVYTPVTRITFQLLACPSIHRKFSLHLSIKKGAGMELNGLENQAAKGQGSSVLSIIHRSRVRPAAVVS